MLQFDIRMRLSESGMGTRFAEEFEIRFRRAKIPLTLWPHKDAKLRRYCAELSPFWARAEYVLLDVLLLHLLFVGLTPLL